MARNSSTTSIRISQTTVGVWFSVRSAASPASCSVLPISASPPPMAIIVAEAKKAVPWRRLPTSWASKTRGSRVTIWRIQSRRKPSISTETEGRWAAGFSIFQPIPTQASTRRASAA